MQNENFDFTKVLLEECIKLLFEFLKFLIVQLWNWYKDRKKKRKGKT